MIDPAETPLVPPASSRRMSSDALSELCGLLAALDQLDRLMALGDTLVGDDDGVPFGRYRLLRKIGAGRFGLVFLASDPTLGRPVVIKVPQPAVLTDAELRARFVREAKAAARLEHPGIVPVYEAGEVNGLAYLTAAFVDGPTLGDWFQAQPAPPPPTEAARLVELLARAVHHAHDRGVLHCDLKPSNILLEGSRSEERGSSKAPSSLDPSPRVTDFGLARLVEDDPALTKTFQVVGTPLYMAPEQARGDRRGLTARADVYALGAILYELLTGKPPHAGGSQAEVLARLQSAPAVSPRKVNPAVPQDLAAICLKCLEKDPDRRYHSADGLADDLARFLDGRPVTARLVGPAGVAARWVARRPFAAGLLVLTAVSVLAAFGLAWHADVRRLKDRLAVEQAERSAAASAEQAEAHEFYATLERVRQRRAARLPGWTADNLVDVGRLARLRLARAELPALRTEAAAARSGFDLPEPRIVADGFKPHPLTFSPDGKLLALGGWLPDGNGTCEVRLIDVATGETARRLFFPADPWWEWWYRKSNADGCRSVAFSPDGRWVVAGTRSGWLVRWDLWKPNPDPIRWRHGPAAPVPTRAQVKALAFTPNGRVLLAAGDFHLSAWQPRRTWPRIGGRTGVMAAVVRPARGSDRVAGVVDGHLYWAADDPPRLVHQPSQLRDQAAAGPGAGTVVTWGDRTDQLRLVDVALGRPVGRLALPDDDRAEDGPIMDLAVSPDGLLLAAGAEHARHLKVWDLVAGRVVAARSLGEGSLRLAFSPDGRTLAVTQEYRTLLYPVPGPGAARPLAVHRFPIRDADQSADGRTLATAAVHASDPAEVQVWAESAESLDRWSVPVHPRGNNRWAVALAPDGRVAYPTSEEMEFRLPPARRSESRDRVRDLKDLRFGPDGALWGCLNSGLYRRAGLDGPMIEVRYQQKGSSGLSPLCIAPGRTVVLAGRADGAICRVRPDGRSECEWLAFPAPVTGIGLSPDEQTAVAGTEGGDVAVIRTADGTKVLDLPAAHQDDVEAVAVGPAGWFATGSWDRTVKIWGPAGRPVLTLFQTRPVRRLFWSADGRTLTVLAEGERALRRWDLGQLRDELAALGLEPGLP